MLWQVAGTNPYDVEHVKQPVHCLEIILWLNNSIKFGYKADVSILVSFCTTKEEPIRCGTCETSGTLPRNNSVGKGLHKNWLRGWYVDFSQFLYKEYYGLFF
jgi:hypothetical protein